MQSLGGVHYIAAFAGSAAFVAVTTPVVRDLANKRRLVDSPDGPQGRKLQDSPVPYLGGLALAAAFTAVVITAVALFGNNANDTRLAASVLIPALALGIVGLIDDLKGLGAYSRFAAQTAAGAATATITATAGTRSTLTGNIALDVAITVLWVVGITNALNLIDNMDGLAGSVAGVAAGAFGVIAALNGQWLIAALSFGLAGSCAGFLFHNWRPASIYMGDAGALFLGFVLAAIGVRLELTGQPLILSLAIPVAVLLVPILDTTLVVIDRIRRGKSPFEGGRDHLSHRLVRTGRSIPGSVLTMSAIGLITGGVALALSRLSLSSGLVLIAVTAAAFVAILQWALRIPHADH